MLTIHTIMPIVRSRGTIRAAIPKLSPRTDTEVEMILKICVACMDACQVCRQVKVRHHSCCVDALGKFLR